jgi:TatA/E family protein of Tat protein translocase
MFGLGTPEILLILVVMLMFFGKDKLPELARSIGKSFRELKSGFEDPLSPPKIATDVKKETPDDAGTKKVS